MKKGISPIITTILLVLIAIMAMLFIYGVVIPFVRDSLSGSKGCFKTVGQLKINTESGYTCKFTNITGGTNKIVNLTIKRGPKEAGIESFIVTVYGGGESKLIKVKEGYSPGVAMFPLGHQVIELPKAGEERTYIISTTLDEVSLVAISPVIEGGIMCKSTDEAQIEEC